MTHPIEARLEADLGNGVALYDVSHLLKRNPAKEETRDDGSILRVYHHHSGALGPVGYNGLLGSVRFTANIRRWPSPPYTYWLSFEPETDDDGRLVVYRCNQDSVRSYHTGFSANDHGVGIAWQGNLSRRRPSGGQRLMATQLCAWLDRRHRLSKTCPHSFHSEAHNFGGKRKAACPGPHVTQWVRDYRSRGVADA